MPIFEKLVRDGVPGFILKEGKKPITKVLSEKEFEQALRQKLLEESTEVAQARNHEDLLKELADVWEVLDELRKAHNISDNELRWKQGERRRERGGFRERIFLESIE